MPIGTTEARGKRPTSQDTSATFPHRVAEVSRRHKMLKTIDLR
jgi:hypothetical protein